jgi:hypothetical protein
MAEWASRRLCEKIPAEAMQCPKAHASNVNLTYLREGIAEPKQRLMEPLFQFLCRFACKCRQHNGLWGDAIHTEKIQTAQNERVRLAGARAGNDLEGTTAMLHHSTLFGVRGSSCLRRQHIQ